MQINILRSFDQSPAIGLTPLYSVSFSSMYCIPLQITEPVFLNVYVARESIPRKNSASLCSLAGRYDNPIPTQCLAPTDFLKIPALDGTELEFLKNLWGLGTEEE
jgi:hypothetical protein